MSKKISYEKFIKLRNIYIPYQKSRKAVEANMTAWFSYLLGDMGLLFSRYEPQCAPGGVVSASEYDFAMIRKKELSVILEIKRSDYPKDKLIKSLQTQVYQYALKEKDFQKGVIICTNGYMYVYAYVFVPTRKAALSLQKEHIQFKQIVTPKDLKNFHGNILIPNIKDVDHGIAEQYDISRLMKAVFQYSGPRSHIWMELKEIIKESKNFKKVGDSEIYKELEKIAKNIKNHRPIDQALSKMIYSVLASERYDKQIKKFISQEFGIYHNIFPVNLAKKAALAQFRRHLC